MQLQLHPWVFFVRFNSKPHLSKNPGFSLIGFYKVSAKNLIFFCVTSLRFVFLGFQGITISELDSREFVSKLLDRKWGLQSPATQIHQISVSSCGKGTCEEQGINKFSFFNNTLPNLGDEVSKRKQGSSFYILRDDLLHPLVNGNKSRKLDALLPLLQDHKVTDLVRMSYLTSLKLLFLNWVLWKRLKA